MNQAKVSNFVKALAAVITSITIGWPSLRIGGDSSFQSQFVYAFDEYVYGIRWRKLSRLQHGLVLTGHTPIMISGSLTINRPKEQVNDRLRMLLAAANCTVSKDDNNGTIRFQHGTYLTASAPLLPKSGTIQLAADDDGTRVSYEIHVAALARAWMILVAVLACWAIFPPILVYRALVVHPRLFIENVLEGV